MEYFEVVSPCLLLLVQGLSVASSELSLLESMQSGNFSSDNKNYILHSPKTVDLLQEGQEICLDENCETKVCWGYEKGCGQDTRLFLPHCDGPTKPWGSTLQEKEELFWRQGDFGYVKDVRDSLVTICEPVKQVVGSGSLVCSANTRYCRARNLLLDLTRFDEIATRQGDRYASFREDIFREGEIGGHCKLDKALLRQHGQHKSPLQSWYAELEEYTGLDFNPFTTGYCDEIVTTPTIFIKLDAGINLYHHYCDFFNLYASLHVNGSFDDNINIVVWDTSYNNYRDFFSETWSAFTHKPLMKLADFAKKKTCFNDVMFPLLARMRGGLYYNTYIVPQCANSGLMTAFSKHLVSRLDMQQSYSESDVVRITLLSRKTKHRRIVNEEELVLAMKTLRNTEVTVAEYSWRDYPFLKQIETSHNTDVFIGMHGAGLTHLLFLPDWASMFEIYNTEDERCYHDLARLRGVQYQTWENDNKIWKEREGLHPQLGTPHAKFTNYTFDVVEFMKLLTALTDSTRERKRSYLKEYL